MTLDDIQSLWSDDCDVQRDDLGGEAVKIASLHSKYFKIFSSERLKLKKMEADHNELRLLRFQYFNGTLDYEELKSFGWDPNPLKILKSDIQIFMEGDAVMIESNLKLALQKEKVDFLDQIIRSLNNRGYNIRAAIDWYKFTIGG